MVRDGIFVPLKAEEQTRILDRVEADGFPRSGEGLSSWLKKAAASRPGVPAAILKGRDYIAANPQVVQQGLNILGAVLRSRRPGA